MTDLTIKDLPDDVHQRLSECAAENGRTAEAEARVALEKQFSVKDDVEGAKDWLQAIEAIQAALRAANGGELPKGVVDEFLAEKRQVAAAEWSRVERYLNGKSGGG